MSVSGFTPPKADLNSPSTETSSGSVLTKEPAAQRLRLDNAAAASSVSEPQRSTAGLVVDCRRMGLTQQDQSATGCGVSGSLACPASGAPRDTDFSENDSDLEAVGSSTGSSASWRPRARAETLQGPSFDDFQRLQQRSGSGSSVPGHRSAAGDEPSSAGEPHMVSSGASCVVGLPGRRGSDPCLKVLDAEEEKVDDFHALAKEQLPDFASCSPLSSGSARTELWSSLPRGPHFREASRRDA